MTSRPWSGYASKIKTATVVDEGIQPKSTARWFYFCTNMMECDLSKLDTSSLTNASGLFGGCSKLTTLNLSSWSTSNVTDMSFMFYGCNKLSADCSKWNVSKVTDHGDFNTNAAGVTVPLAWQAPSDEGDEDSAIAPLCEEQGNGDALSVSDENGNDEAASKTDGEASADSETTGNAGASADSVDAKGEEAPDDDAQEDPIAA